MVIWFIVETDASGAPLQGNDTHLPLQDESLMCIGTVSPGVQPEGNNSTEFNSLEFPTGFYAAKDFVAVGPGAGIPRRGTVLQSPHNAQNLSNGDKLVSIDEVSATLATIDLEGAIHYYKKFSAVLK